MPHCLLDEDAKIDDVAELKLYEKILAGDMNAIKFRLATKARHRDYGDVLEAKGKVSLAVKMSDATKAELTSVLAEVVAALRQDEDAAEPDLGAGADPGPGDDGADQERHGVRR